MEKRSMGSLMSALRKSKGMTQQDIADKLGISNKTVSKWECDDGYPDISMLPAIAEIYGVSIDELLKGEIRNDEKQDKTISADKSKRQIELLLSTAFEKFKNSSVIALVLAILSVVLGYLLKNIIDEYIFEENSALIAFCISLIISVVAIIFEWIAGSRLLFSLSGDDTLNYTDRIIAYLKGARNFITAVIGIALTGIFSSGAMWLYIHYYGSSLVASIIGIAIAFIAALALFFFLDSKLFVRITDEKIKAKSEYSKKTALGLIICTLCVAIIASGTVGGVFRIANHHTVKFDNKETYNDYMAFSMEEAIPLLEKDEKNLKLTVVDNFDFSADNGNDMFPDFEGVIGQDCDEVVLTIADNEDYCFDTYIYTFDTKENMDKFVEEFCVDGGFLSTCTYEMLFKTYRVFNHNDEKMSIKYTTGNFSDIAGICALIVAGICIVFDGTYIALRCCNIKKQQRATIFKKE